MVLSAKILTLQLLLMYCEADQMDLLNQLPCLLYTVLGKKRWQKLTLSFSLYHSLTLLYCFKVSVQLLATCC